MSATVPESEGGTIAGTPVRPGRTMLAVGVVLSLLGLVAIVFPFVTGVSISIALGALLVVGALFHVAHAFGAGGWRGFALQALLAGIYAIAGIGLLANPVLGLATLTLLLVGYFLADGVVEVLLGVRMRGESGAMWFVASGVISIVLAGLLWAGWPSTAAWAVGLLFGISLLSSGLSMVFVGMRADRTERRTGATA
ncbi:HdeD family acid-resistance protein [Halomarina salina]|uniref:HdeD family acid-resistance protein n=1 Tax=Halomarina salina TaxID=1872699 RepID=A0ABD5RJU3_9EURY|nr:HdeD family acid-resistance protein [Halomarina salina]